MSEKLFHSILTQEVNLPVFNEMIAEIALSDMSRGFTRFKDESSCVNVGETKQIGQQPLFTVGAYSCYAGIKQTISGLYMWHYRKNTTQDEIDPILIQDGNHIFGRAFEHDNKTHWLAPTNSTQLPIQSFTPINLLMNPLDNTLYYSYGEASFPEGYE